MTIFGIYHIWYLDDRLVPLAINDNHAIINMYDHIWYVGGRPLLFDSSHSTEVMLLQIPTLDMLQIKKTSNGRPY